jgi:DNA-binding CsgD family transcriptional regulator
MSEHDADREAIIALIHRNRIAVWTQDYEAYASCFVHAPYTTRWNASHINGVFIHAGWDDISERAREMFAARPDLKVPANAHQTAVENLMLRIEGNLAWALFDQRYPTTTTIHSRGLTREMRVFERHDGEWKVAFLGYLDEDASRPGSLMLELDPQGAVIWQTPAAIAALSNDDDLVIRNGRLRIRDSRTNERLQAAIRWAAARNTGYLIERGALPIVCDAGEGAPVKVWWVIAESGKVWFSFGDAGLTEPRLSAAAAVFGLSPAQLQVARFIAEGLSLTEIADRLEITPNTARTHLNRVFEKTGVHTQPALVRVLLTAIAPV